ncbi:hypothetical protein [Catenuloplanes niger]|uniref:Uncharacterized protein n=1 Tax=Catenuloplanes niger TaxID=587534 RepID=A0AAE3ZRC1_9ACTN|nr:hypothetical protein [Catenuloplanes niger]MDR7323360.1 hypothetical protein [Catenuloplanes niger]
MSVGQPSVSPLGGAGGGQITARLHLGTDGIVRIRLSVLAAPGVHATAWLLMDEWERLAKRVAERQQERPA